MMARQQQQMNIRHRSVVSFVGISEHGRCGYCKFTKQAHGRAKFAAANTDCENASSSAASSDVEQSTASSMEDSSISSNGTTTSTKPKFTAVGDQPQHDNNNDDGGGAENDADDDDGNSAVFGLWAHQLTVPHYQSLADRGWRRSGRFLYKPLMDRTCCPQYTIRLDVHKFRLSRTQKRVLRTMGDFLRTNQRPKQRPQIAMGMDNEMAGPSVDGWGGGGTTATVAKRGGTTSATPQKEDGGGNGTTTPPAAGDGPQQQQQRHQHRRKRRRRGSSTTTRAAAVSSSTPAAAATVSATSAQPKKAATKPKKSPDQPLKRKEMRRQRAEARLRARGVDLEEYKRNRAAAEAARRRTIQSFLDGYNGPGWAHTFELRLLGQPSPELDADFEEEFELFKHYQVQIHREAEEDVTPEVFQRFLASSPLFPGPSTAVERHTSASTCNDNQPQQQDGLPACPPLGSFHQQYRLDGRLIAVAVIDLLPHCLSAKYFFYDPDYAFLSLGTYSALREIAFTQRLTKQRPDLHFYYMGFYLYDCPKMRYKSRFRPSELLCDHCLNWVPVEECDRIIEANGGHFSTFHALVAGGEPARAQLDDAQIDHIVCFYGDPPRPLTFASLRQSLLLLAATHSGSLPPAEEDHHHQPDHAGIDAAPSTPAVAALLDQLTQKVRLYAYYAGPAALEMVVILT